MKKLILASSILAAFAGNVAHAEEAAPAPDHAFAFNVGAVSDYRFRGISQSRLSPAVFAGVDYTNNPTGFYVGAWTSTIKWVKDQGGDANTEIDIYGGKRGEISGVSYDLGLIRYYYPSNAHPTVSANTTEAYAQLGYGPAYIKYSQALTNFVAWADGSDGSNYIDIGANPEIGSGYILNVHAGKQVVKNYSNGAADYTDWKVGVTKDYGFAVAALAVVGTDADKAQYTWGGKYVGKTGVTLSLTKSF
jgi:uncharacterized protein (TIGR02001 family)